MGFKTAVKYLPSLLAALAMLSCSGHSDEHHHDDETVQATAYTDSLELFAEVSAMSVEEECRITAHFTALPDFKPTGRRATVTLTVGGKSVSATADEPVKPGIFRFELLPPAVGEAVMEFTVESDGSVFTIKAGGLEVFADEHEAAHEAREHELKSGNAVVFTKEMAWKSDFATASVEMREVGNVIRTMGLVEALPGETRTVTARNSGVVVFVNPELTMGTGVAAGQALFRIDGTQTAEGNLGVQLAELKSEYETARRELEREEDLLRDKLTTAAEVNAARNACESARARYEHLRAGFGSGGSTASSPIAGFLTQLDVANGQYVEAGQALATVAQTRDVVIRAEVAPRHYNELGQITGAVFHRPNSDRSWTLEELEGKTLSYGRSVAGGNALVPVSFKVRNTQDFVPGTYVDLFIKTGGGGVAPAVPNGALIEETGVKSVYVQLTPELFEKRIVTAGATDGTHTAVTSGVKPGERVVSKGAVLVKLSQASGTLDPHAGHVH